MTNTSLQGRTTKKIFILQKFVSIIKKDKFLLLMMLPGIIYYIVFRYGPMYGVLMAFTDYKITRGIWGSEWVGLENFIRFLTGYNAFRIIRNTLILNIMGLVFSFPVPIIFAILLNELRHKNLKTVVQTISYLPHFISTVVIVGIVRFILDPQHGIINYILSALFGMKPVTFMIKPEYFRSIYILTDIWRETGWSSIIFLAALTSIDLNLYEAAIIDGANRIKQAIHVTIPGIMPVIIIMFILQLGRIMDVGFETVFLMYTPLTYETSDVIATYVYRKGLLDMDFGFATAAGLFQSIVGFTLMLTANKLIKKVSSTSLL